MVRDVIVASKSKFIDRVLEAISKLGEKNGSISKDILNYMLKNSQTVNRNLTVKLQRSLKRAVAEGLVRLSGGRYKIRHIVSKTQRPTSVVPTALPPTSPPPVKTDEDTRKTSKDARRASRKTRKRIKTSKVPRMGKTNRTKSGVHPSSGGKSKKKNSSAK